MTRTHVPALALTTVLCTGAAFALVQERVKQKKADFPTTHAAVLQQWNAGEYGACLEGLRELTGMVSVKRVESLLKVLPAAPEGFEVESETTLEDLQDQPFLGMAGMIGSSVERSYGASDGAHLQLTVTADSPVAQMWSVWLANPQMIDPSAEVVKYQAHSAILKQDGETWELTALIHGKHVIEVRLDGRDDEFLLKFLDQKTVDALARVLGG